MRAYEDRIDPATGQDITLSTDPALAEYWTTMPAVRDFAHTALSEARKRDENRDHPEALRYIVGLREGWKEALAASRESATPDE